MYSFFCNRKLLFFFRDKFHYIFNITSKHLAYLAQGISGDIFTLAHFCDRIAAYISELGKVFLLHVFVDKHLPKFFVAYCHFAPLNTHFFEFIILHLTLYHEFLNISSKNRVLSKLFLAIPIS